MDKREVRKQMLSLILYKLILYEFQQTSLTLEIKSLYNMISPLKIYSINVKMHRKILNNFTLKGGSFCIIKI